MAFVHDVSTFQHNSPTNFCKPCLTDLVMSLLTRIKTFCTLLIATTIAFEEYLPLVKFQHYPPNSVSTFFFSHSPRSYIFCSALGGLNNPRGIKVDKSGAIYVCDSGNHSIRKYFPNGAVKTWAGTGKAGFEDGTSASFTNPEGLCIDSVGNLFVTEAHRVRKIEVDGTVSTIAGRKHNLHQDGSKF